MEGGVGCYSDLNLLVHVSNVRYSNGPSGLGIKCPVFSSIFELAFDLLSLVQKKIVTELFNF